MSDDDFCRGDEEKKEKPPAVNEVKDTAQDGGQNADDIGHKKLERILQTLTSQRRRYILYEMQENEVSDIDSLATTVTAMVQEVPPEKVKTKDVDNMKSQLIHAELPALADAGFIEYDQRSKAVRYSNPPSLLDGFLRLSAKIDSPSDQSS
ncbi:DUF7344 domain-containing protein [Natronorubrum sp. FCH18a]|uniref:DUF7344 domain-containing protein n=1 Tax=Natronorubrum sp. FCH18a TaxID=3447018 RepID=UPI003F510FA7